MLGVREHRFWGGRRGPGTLGGQTPRGRGQRCALGNQMPVVQAKLVEDVCQMELDRRLANAEPRRDFLVTEPLLK